MTLDREACLRFMFDRTIPIYVRASLVKKMSKLDKEVKIFKDLRFHPHPYKGLIGPHAEEAHLNFINGLGVNVIRNVGGSHKYYVQRITRNGGEFMDKDRLNNMDYWDRAVNTAAEVSKIMRDIQKKPKKYNGIVAVISGINYLHTYKEGKK